MVAWPGWRGMAGHGQQVWLPNPSRLCLTLRYNKKSYPVNPALLTKKTKLLIPSSILALFVNIGANRLLIPSIGAWGAAWPRKRWVAYQSHQSDREFKDFLR